MVVLPSGNSPKSVLLRISESLRAHQVNDHAPAVPGADQTRFQFGENWRRFVDRLNEERIIQAEQSLKSLLGFDDLHGLTFLDVGCGSGLFSLAARRLGARVRSFDYDADSVRCAVALQARYFASDSEWQIE